MARRGWETLSDAYRRRLERGGINKRKYERGDSLSKARGHEQTPEHGPNDVQIIRQRDRFERYRARQANTQGVRSNLRVRVFNHIARELVPYLRDHHIDTIRRPVFTWNDRAILNRLKSPYNKETGEKWDREIMQEFLGMHGNDFADINWADPQWSFLWYH